LLDTRDLEDEALVTGFCVQFSIALLAVIPGNVPLKHAIGH